jgi:hypothetical protein
MSYYKITYESDTIEGLRAIQGDASDKGASAGNAATFETQVPPPLPEEEANSDVFSGAVSAPPNGNEAGLGLDFSDEFSPPPQTTDSGISATGLDDAVPPPPTGESGDQNDNDGPVPPRQPAPKGGGK